MTAAARCANLAGRKAAGELLCCPMVSWVIGRALLKIRVVALARPTSGGSVAQMAILRSSTTPTVVYGAASHVTGAKRGRDQSFLVTSWMMAWRATYRRVLRAIDARVTLVNSDR